VVEASGGGLLARRVLGRRVAVLNSTGGNWQEQVVIPARQAVPVPAHLSDEQAATFFVNPASALAMTRYVLRIPPGAWLIQTAAGSALGRMVIRLGRHYRFRTINIVRRREQRDELLRAGADAVICSSDEPIPERVYGLTGGAGAAFAIDAVGGATGSDVARSLAAGGRMLVYGTLSEEPMAIHPRVLMVGQKRVEGFWLSEWIRAQRIVTLLLLFRRLRGLFREGLVTSTIAGTYGLDDIRAAVTRASTPGNQGKVILRMSNGS
jgi:NADPH:quinone reductase-like Zn-dependent oxidoreductase